MRESDPSRRLANKDLVVVLSLALCLDLWSISILVALLVNTTNGVVALIIFKFLRLFFHLYSTSVLMS